MMKYVIIFAVASVLVSCSDSTPPEHSNPPNLRILSAAEAKIASSGNEFAFNLYREVQDPEPANTFISPLSVGYALGMALNGATEETRQSILNTIDFGSLSADEVNTAYRDLTSLLLSMDNQTKISIANSVWNHHDFTVKNSFSNIITQYYNGTVQALNFRAPETRNTINNWVENKTNGKIKDLLGEISPDEVMFLINAIYFKSNWSYQFDKSKTHKAPFTKLDGSNAEVNMMFSKGVSLSRYQNENFTLIDIPYGNEQFRMTLVVPSQPQNFSEVVNSISAGSLSQWLEQSDTLTCELEIPKFKMTWKNDLKESLGEMGMLMHGFPDFFEEEPSLAISRVIHQSFIEVNEEGSEAAAATAIGVELTSATPTPQRITIDRPFLFLIRESHSSVVLFIGQLVDPDTL